MKNTNILHLLHRHAPRAAVLTRTCTQLYKETWLSFKGKYYRASRNSPPPYRKYNVHLSEKPHQNMITPFITLFPASIWVQTLTRTSIDGGISYNWWQSWNLRGSIFRVQHEEGYSWARPKTVWKLCTLSNRYGLRSSFLCCVTRYSTIWAR